MFASYAPTPPDYPPRFVFFRFCFFLVFFSLSLHSSPSPYHLRHHLNHTISCRRVAVAAYLLLTRALIANIYEKIDRCIGHHRTTCTSFFSFFARPTDRDQSREQSYAPQPPPSNHKLPSSGSGIGARQRRIWSRDASTSNLPLQLSPITRGRLEVPHRGKEDVTCPRAGTPCGPRPSKTQPASKPINKFGRSRSWGGWATSTSLSHPLPPSSIHQPYFSAFAVTKPETNSEDPLTRPVRRPSPPSRQPLDENPTASALRRHSLPHSSSSTFPNSLSSPSFPHSLPYHSFVVAVVDIVVIVFCFSSLILIHQTRVNISHH